MARTRPKTISELLDQLHKTVIELDRRLVEYNDQKRRLEHALKSARYDHVTRTVIIEEITLHLAGVSLPTWTPDGK